jgi:uncharacterized protein (DUF433 family)
MARRRRENVRAGGHPARPSDEELIERYIDQNFDHYPSGRADARLRDSGVSVWEIVAFLRVYQNDRDKVAQHFDLSTEEVAAALAFYQLNQAYIDGRILLNEA